jgi:hypothetical protein
MDVLLSTFNYGVAVGVKVSGGIGVSVCVAVGVKVGASVAVDVCVCVGVAEAVGVLVGWGPVVMTS